MLRAFAFLAGLALATLSTSRPFAGQSPQRGDLKAGIDSFVDRQIATDSFSGTLLVARNGQIVYQRAAGIANRETGAPIKIDTRMQIASATKLFTQIAIRQLEQGGKLSLGDTVGRFLPNYPNTLVRRKVTIDQLLRHTSGVGSFWNARYMAGRADVRSTDDYLALFQNDSLLFEPGTSQAYSNGGYVLLGAIIERASGMSYHDYLRQRIFTPAGMTETVPYDRRGTAANAAVGYTAQTLDGPVSGDRRLAGGGAPPRRAAPDAARRSNAGLQPGMSGPAGDHYSTVGDFLKLANALTSRRLLDSAHTAALFGPRYSSGSDFRSNGGGPGVNAEFSIYPSGDVMGVLANYDPPSATAIAQFVRSLLAPVGAQSPQTPLRLAVDSLHAAMVAAFKRDPASVARFYTDDATILGGGGRWAGREQINRYWSQGPTPADWILEVLEVGGDTQSPWVRGRSTLVSQSGQRMVTDYVGILKREPGAGLKF